MSEKIGSYSEGILTFFEWRRFWTRRLLAAGADLAAPFWELGFWLAGRVKKKQVRGWQSKGGRLVLVLAPHADDEAAGCAGTMQLHRRAGEFVSILVVTDGRLAASLLAPGELAKQRQREAECAAAALNVDRLEWAGFKEGEFWLELLVEKLKGTLDKIRPDIVYTTSRLDIHPDHHRVAYALAAALEGGDIKPVIRVYQVHVPLTAVLTNLVTDISVETEAIRAVFNCYSSQWWHLGRTLRMRRYAGRYYDRGKLCETFWEMTAEKFCQLHGKTADLDRDGLHWSLKDFVGMRYFSWCDPMAYLKGRSRRVKLQDVVQKTLHRP